MSRGLENRQRCRKSKVEPDMKRTEKMPLLEIKGECCVLDAKSLFTIVAAIAFLTACASDTEMLSFIIDYFIFFLVCQYIKLNMLQIFACRI